MENRQTPGYKTTDKGEKKRKEEKTNIEQGTHHQEATGPTNRNPPTANGSNIGSVAPHTHRRSRGYQGF
ncbi:hypothetical protein A2U01_0082179 [Trifolium medium]|uniref:Uncharacterized protein n=1 Tax=Trifolium medium TaxID=97028 RepID=A0A392TIG9_9FABA|nr:hypothetical protein [Trifolium medium]